MKLYKEQNKGYISLSQYVDVDYIRDSISLAEVLKEMDKNLILTPGRYLIGGVFYSFSNGVFLETESLGIFECSPRDEYVPRNY